MQIRKGTLKDAKEVGHLYDHLCEYLENHTNYPGWKKDIYPTIDDAEDGIREQNLFVAVEDEKIVGTVIIRHKPEEMYKNATWGQEISYDKIYVVYTLAVLPEYIHKGIGVQIMQFIEAFARKQNMKAIRLDVVEDNIPAIRLYEECGYTYVDTIDLGYHEYGLDWFRLYEKNL